MFLKVACAISLALLIPACSSKTPAGHSPSAPVKQDNHAGQIPRAKDPRPKKAEAVAFNKAKIWQQLLSLGHLPLSSLQACGSEPGDKRTLFTYLAQVLGVVGGGMPSEKAALAKPEADYTLKFDCSLEGPGDHEAGCIIMANDLDSTGMLAFGLHFKLEANTHHIVKKSITCDYF